MSKSANGAQERLSSVMVGVDFSDSSRLAFDRACDVAALNEALMVIVHVLPSAPMSIHGVQPVLSAPDLSGRIRELAEQKLVEFEESAASRGVSARTVLTLGTPGPALSEMARDEGVDCLVVGSRGLTGVKHLVLGSTAEHAVRNAPCPVLAIHPDDGGSLVEPKTAIVPIELHGDPSEAGRRIHQLLGNRVDALKVLLLYCDHVPVILQPWLVDLGIERVGLEEIRSRVAETVAPAVASLGALGFEVETLVEEGEPASVISELARTRKADLIAMQTHARTGTAHWLLGSTTERVVQHAGCAVLALHEGTGEPAA
ncbi:MAG: universal stress protein [Myxococcota bacterium]|nr:universal stress protein [Myxococcota bacterium]